MTLVFRELGCKQNLVRHLWGLKEHCIWHEALKKKGSEESWSFAGITVEHEPESALVTNAANRIPRCRTSIASRLKGLILLPAQHRWRSTWSAVSCARLHMPERYRHPEAGPVTWTGTNSGWNNLHRGVVESDHWRFPRPDWRGCCITISRCSFPWKVSSKWDCSIILWQEPQRRIHLLHNLDFILLPRDIQERTGIFLSTYTVQY